MRKLNIVNVTEKKINFDVATPNILYFGSTGMIHE